VNLMDLRKQSLKRFGQLLREVCEVAGLTQGKLAKAAKAELKLLIARGELHAEESVGSLSQSALSRVMAGLQEPTYFQVFLWLRVIKTHYGSARLAQTCQELGLAIPEFSAERERMLWNLASFLPPDELARVDEQSHHEKPLDDRPSLINHKEKRMQFVRSRLALSHSTSFWSTRSFFSRESVFSVPELKRI
jgi:transcriptional regulator with XRE-family HTH domain